jgi:hypothetical protein
MLFLYKKYNFDFESFQKKINSMADDGSEYSISLDKFVDLSLPDTVYMNMKGGDRQSVWMNKYIKYKTKYLKLKEIKNK